MKEEVISSGPSSWQIITANYRTAAAVKIPEAWRLDSKFTADVNQNSDQSVLDVPAKCGVLSELELELTEKYDAVALLELLAKGEVSSVEVTTAFSKRSAIAQQVCNCLTETFFDQALERAKDCDAYLDKEKKTLGPLHGLPISIKDSFNVKGIYSTIGYTSFIDHGPATEDSALVKILIDLGAVLYVKTNVPQSLMTADSDNNVFGRCLNPNKLSLGAGGSSGGEGALLAMKGCPIGVGTDIAGSIRIPAYVNGIFGFKPTSRRIPYGGQKAPGRPGSPGIMAVAGPLARSVRDVEAFTKAVLNYACWTVDEVVLSVPYLEPKTVPEKLTIGVIFEDPKYPAHPPVLRSLKTAVAKLEEAGHNIIDLGPLLPPNALVDAMVTAFTGFALDPAKTSFANIDKSGEPIVPSIFSASLPELKQFTPTVDDVFRLNVERVKIQAVFRKLWVANSLDGILMPAYQSTAAPHDQYGIAVYTVLANLLDYPAMVLPYLKADKQLDAKYRRDVAYSPAYIPDAIEGAPAGVQLMGRFMKDEELIAIAPAVVKALGIPAQL